MRRIAGVAVLLVLLALPVSAYGFTTEPASIAAAWSSAAAAADASASHAWVAAQSPEVVTALVGMAARSGALGSTSAAVQASFAQTSTVERGLYSMGQYLQTSGKWDDVQDVAAHTYDYGGLTWYDFTTVGGWWDLLGFSVGQNGTTPRVYSNTMPEDWATTYAAYMGCTVSYYYPSQDTSETRYAVAQLMEAVDRQDGRRSSLIFTKSGNWVYLSNIQFGYFSGAPDAPHFTVMWYGSTAQMNSAVAAGLANNSYTGGEPYPAVQQVLDAAVHWDSTLSKMLGVPSDVVQNVGNGLWSGIGFLNNPGNIGTFVPPLVLGGIGNTRAGQDFIDTAIEELDNLPTDWAWLSSPFNGFMNGLKALLAFAGDVWGTVQRWFADLFSPNPDYINAIAKARMAALQASASMRFPFVTGDAIAAVQDYAEAAAQGAAATEAMNLESQRVFSAFGVNVEINALDWFVPLKPYRWLAQAFLWVGAAFTFIRMTRPVVGA